MTRHLFHAIDDLFRPNYKDDTAREEPISLKKLRKVAAAWSMQKFVLGWTIDTVKKFLTLTDDCKHNLLSLLDTIPTRASQCSRRRRHKLLGTLRSTVPAISGAAGMFTCLQHALRTAKSRRINLFTPVHSELNLWRHLVASLATRPTHLREIRPHPPTWIGATDAYFTGMGGVCYSPSREWHVWWIAFSTTIRSHILTNKNPKGTLTINDLDLAAYIAHLHIFAPCMAPLEHIATGVDNIAAESWARPGSVSNSTAIAPLLREAAWIMRQDKIHASINRIPGIENIKTAAASRLTHLPVTAFIKSFNTPFPQSTTGRLYLLPSGMKLSLHTMLLTKQSPKASQLPDFAKTTKRGDNRTPSVHGCTWLRIPTYLKGIKYPIPFLQIFAHKVCTGFLAANHKPIHKRSVEQYIRSVGKIFAAMGAPYPRLKTMGSINFRLGRQFVTYTKEDHPPGRVRPLPVSTPHHMDSIDQ